MEIINNILEWPIIAQGALGSGLFWLILVTGQYITKIIHLLYTKVITKHTADVNDKEYVAISAILANDPEERSAHLIFMIYASIHYFIKSFMFFAMGWISAQFIPVFGFIGYAVGFFYIFRALVHCPNLDKYSGRDKEELRDRLAKLKTKKANKSLNQTGAKNAPPG